MNFLSLDSGETVTSVLALPREIKEQQELSLMMITKRGVAKKVDLDSLKDVRRGGIIAIKLGKVEGEGDELHSVLYAKKGDSASVATMLGQSIRFDEKDIRQMGRAAAGVRAIKLGKGDKVIGADVVEKKTDKKVCLFVMSDNGYGKCTGIDEYKVQHRGGSGIKTAKVTEKTGKLVVAKLLTDEDVEIVAISKKGQVIRVDGSEVPKLGRQTQGVRIMKLRPGDSIASMTCL